MWSIMAEIVTMEAMITEPIGVGIELRLKEKAIGKDAGLLVFELDHVWPGVYDQIKRG